MITKSYLLVYHARSGVTDTPLIDVGNDPDLRDTPMTWGICRTNVRRWATPGTDLFFVAYPEGGHKCRIDERYYLTAYLHVAERIGQDEAVRRFSGRQNVILDHLPPGSSFADRLYTYLRDHVGELAWQERELILRELKAGSGSIFDYPCRYMVSLDGECYVHSYWDPHADWRQRITAPYIIADETLSKALGAPVPYALCAAECAELPQPDTLMAAGSHKHAARRLSSNAAAYLISRARSVPDLSRVAGSVASVPGCASCS